MRLPAQSEHVSDENLLLHHAGELQPVLQSRVALHLNHCPRCRQRLQNLVAVEEETGAAALQLPAVDFARANLQRRLSEAAARPVRHARKHALIDWLQKTRVPAFFLRAGIVLALLVLTVTSRQMGRPLQDLMGMYEETGPEPDHTLTPGSAASLTVAEVCRRNDDDLDPPVTPELQQAVFRAYRMGSQAAQAYQVDYLINPQLGGDSSLSNLWPEPYHATVWNATAKDALEMRLHGMVCSGELDLHTAQRELADDWIAAYKKYFHTIRPVRTVAQASRTK